MAAEVAANAMAYEKRVRLNALNEELQAALLSGPRADARGKIKKADREEWRKRVQALEDEIKLLEADLAKLVE
jgi:hypothetical protein